MQIPSKQQIGHSSRAQSFKLDEEMIHALALDSQLTPSFETHHLQRALSAPDYHAFTRSSLISLQRRH